MEIDHEKRQFTLNKQELTALCFTEQETVWSFNDADAVLGRSESTREALIDLDNEECGYANGCRRAELRAGRADREKLILALSTMQGQLAPYLGLEITGPEQFLD